MTVYLSSFYPLCCTNAGKSAVDQYNLPPFIDGSCRREPDFENKFPAITGLCRPGFATKLKVSDVVIYTTNKKGIGSRKIIAVLKVLKTNCENHEQAAEWYRKKKFIIPNNIMVKENKPFDLKKTHQMGGWDSWVKGTDNVKDWNKHYINRAEDNPIVAICFRMYHELYNPIELTEKEMKRIFNRRPGTRNPSIVKDSEWKELKKIIGKI